VLDPGHDLLNGLDHMAQKVEHFLLRNTGWKSYNL
jgi:hypothetical protein